MEQDKEGTEELLTYIDGHEDGMKTVEIEIVEYIKAGWSLERLLKEFEGRTT